MNNIRILTTTEIANRRLVWAKHLQKENDKLEAELKRLRPMADELIAIWEILEEDYPHVDRAIVKELIERKIGDYEVIE